MNTYYLACVDPLDVSEGTLTLSRANSAADFALTPVSAFHGVENGRGPVSASFEVVQAIAKKLHTRPDVGYRGIHIGTQPPTA